MSAVPTSVSRARRELVAARHIPYTALVAPEVLRTGQGDYVQAIRVGGIAFESADDEAVNAWHERLNALWRNVASPHVALWVHVVRRREATESPPWTCPGCSEAVPANFEVCWKCQTARADNEAQEDDDSPDA